MTSETDAPRVREPGPRTVEADPVVLDRPETVYADAVRDSRVVDRAAYLASVGAALAGSLNPRRTILRLLSLTRPLADWAMVVIPEGGGVTLHGGADAGFSTSVGMPTTRMGIGRVLRSGQAELLHVALHTEATDTYDGLDSMVPHPALRAEAVALRPADVLGLPLNARGTTIGVLVLVRGAGRGFDEDDLALAEEVAVRAAVAVDSARLYEERARVASVLQAGLRPPTLPVVPGARVAARFRAAAGHLDVGGDFYDVHGGNDDWLLVLGDVCGKGVEAAVLTGRSRQSIRTAVHFDPSPSGVLSALNAVLYDEDSDRFVTVVCARLRRDGDAASVDLAVAGHPPPLVLRADGRVEDVTVAGTVAGVLPEVDYDEVTLRLEPGDTMLMFTDGILEARNEDGFYGLERLRALLPAYARADPAVVCEAVERDVESYLDGRAHDDMALFAVTVGR